MTIPSQRHLFDIPDDLAYLNCAYMSPLMKGVTAAGREGVQRKSRPWEITQSDFFTESEHARTLFARIINATAEDIAIVPAVSYGIAVAAKNLPLSAGQKILVLADQFSSNVYAWRERAAAVGAELLTVPDPKDGDLSVAVLEAMDARVAIVALPNCRWTDGALIDLVEVGRRCRDLGAALVVDLAQSAGVLPFDVTAVKPDLLVAATYKWLLGPYSLGFLYVAPQWQSSEALEYNWIARAGSEDFARLVDYQDDFQTGARRFDMGERSNFHLMPMAVAAMTQILDWGVGEIAATLASRTGEIAGRAAELDLSAAPSHLRASHFLGLRFPSGVPEDLLSRLAHDRVFVSVRGDSMRITPHLYNTDEDIERLFSALHKAEVGSC